METATFTPTITSSVQPSQAESMRVGPAVQSTRVNAAAFEEPQTKQSKIPMYLIWGVIMVLGCSAFYLITRKEKSL